MTSNDPQAQTDASINQLVIVALAEGEAGGLIKTLIQHHYRCTLVNASGGWAGSAEVFVLVGISNEQHNDLLELIGSVCGTHRQFVPARGSFFMPDGLPPLMIEAEIGSAQVYTLAVDRYEAF